MNYLAHFLLSFGDDDLLAGQFLTDAYKGKRFLELPKGIARGVILHRHIDAFTDGHKEILDMRKIVRPVLGHWSSPALDVLCDHLLLRNWQTFAAGKPAEQFISYIYATLERYKPYFDNELAVVFHHMKKNNWLNMYGTYAGMQQIFEGMSRRLPEAQNLVFAIELFRHNEIRFEQAFLRFYPELVSSSEQKLLQTNDV